jgi:antirestriction protein ArdC
MTFKQVAEDGGSIIKGEKSTPITFSEVIYFDVNDQGKKLTPKAAKQAFLAAQERNSIISSYKEAGIYTKRFLRYYAVFNVAQTKGLSSDVIAPQLINFSKVERYERADEMIRQHSIDIRHVVANSAHYNIVADYIQMPFIEQFSSTENYYATLFHETVHWSGHEKRLHRKIGKRETEEYAFEELVAELGSAFLCAHFQLPASLTSTSAYIKSWLSALQRDRNYLLKAISYSEKAMNYLSQPQPSILC